MEKPLPVTTVKPTMKIVCVSSLLLFLILILLPLHALAVARTGGWRPIENVKDPHVVEIGQFAVSEYDRRSEADLKFVGVVSGETQVVAGTNYKLILKAKTGGGPTKNYVAIVWEKTWLKFKNLTSFEPFNGQIQ